MKAIIASTVWGLALLFLAPGCRTDLAVNFGNGTPSTVWVASSQTGKEAEIPAGQFKKLPHSSGDLILRTTGNKKLTFRDVAPFHVDKKYLGGRDNIVGVDSVVLTVLVETNMQLYVVMPGKKTVDPNVAQPKGYPKVGERLSN